MFFTVVAVAFRDTTYLVSEDDEFVEITLVLDNPSCVSITIFVQPRIHMFGAFNTIASGKLLICCKAILHVISRE